MERMNTLKALSVAAVLIGASAQAGTTVSEPIATVQNPAAQAQQIIAKKTVLHSLARDACFLMSGIDGTDFEARVSSSLVDMQGDGADGRNPAAMDQLNAQIQTLSPALRQIIAGDFHAVPIRQLLTLEPAAQADLTALLVTFDRAASAEGKSMAAPVRTVNEQKMRVQKMTKEACFVSRGISAAANRASLAETIAIFSEVNDDITKAATGRERAYLEALGATWRQFSALAQSIPTNGNMHDGAKKRMSALSEDLMDTLRDLEEHLESGADNQPNFAMNWF